MSAARIAATTLFGAATLLAGAALAAPASADTVTECADGVLVVVDFTDLGGEVETGCAEGDPESGRDALELAGFAPADGDVAGMICTIDSQPDPCPTEFDGSFWAYWQVVDGDWESSMVGADEADPVPGGVEGWRYNDGSVPPPLPGAAGDDGSDDTATDDTATDDTSADAADTDSSGISPALWAVIGVLVVAAIIGVVIRVTGSRAEKAADGAAGPGPDKE